MVVLSAGVWCLRVPRCARADSDGVAPRARPTFFASPKKVGKERRPQDARPSAACGDGGLLRFSKTEAATEWRVGCAAA